MACDFITSAFKSSNLIELVAGEKSISTTIGNLQLAQWF